MRRKAGHDSPSTQSSAPSAADPPALDIQAYRVVADCLTAMTLRLDAAIATMDTEVNPALADLLLSLQADAHRAVAAFRFEPDAT